MSYLPLLLRETAKNLASKLVLDSEFFPTLTDETKKDLAKIDVEVAIRRALIDAVSHDDLIDLRTLLHLKAQLYWHYDCGLPHSIAEGIYRQYGKNADSANLVQQMHLEFGKQCSQRKQIFVELHEQSIRSGMNLDLVKQFLIIPKIFLERLTHNGYITLRELEENWIEFFNPRLSLPK